jgi:tetratricopeptide (TPR) repeat protein
MISMPNFLTTSNKGGKGPPVEAVIGGKKPIASELTELLDVKPGGTIADATEPLLDQAVMKGIFATEPVAVDPNLENEYLELQAARDAILFDTLTEAGMPDIGKRFGSAEELMSNKKYASAGEFYRDLVKDALDVLDTAGIRAVIALIRNVVESQGVHTVRMESAKFLAIYQRRIIEAETLIGRGKTEEAIEIFEEMSRALDRLGDVSRGGLIELWETDPYTSMKAYMLASQAYARLLSYYEANHLTNKADQARLTIGTIFVKMARLCWMDDKEHLFSMAAEFYIDAAKIFYRIGRIVDAKIALLEMVDSLKRAGRWEDVAQVMITLVKYGIGNFIIAENSRAGQNP